MMLVGHEVVDDMFHGFGEYTYKSGSVYRGFFARDMFHGIGTFRFEDGAIEKNEDRYRLDFKSEKPEKSEDSMLKFGDDDIDIPTFLRNSN